jgi:hypothetical protein
MTHDELKAAIPLYTVGALERTERQSLEAHLLSGCSSCRTTLKAYQSVAVTFPFRLNIIAPPRTLKGRLMSSRVSVSGTGSETRPPSKPSLEPGEWMNHLFPPTSPPTTSFWWALGTVILVILVVLMFFGWNSASTQVTMDMEQLAQLRTQAEETSSQLAALQRQLSEREESLAQLQMELQRRMAELVEVKDQLVQRDAEVEELKAQLFRRNSRSGQISSRRAD